MLVLFTLCGVIALLALIYSCLILFLPRFHHINNIFILNICISMLFCTIYFAIFFYMSYSYIPQSTCMIFLMCYHIASVNIPFAFTIFSVHRLCTLRFHTVYFFKTKKWVILCISSAWILQILLAFPYIVIGQKNKVNSIFINLYGK